MIIRCKQRVERLRLDLVERTPITVELLEFLSFQGRGRKWLQIEQRRVRRKLFGEYKLVERQSDASFAVHPPIGD